MQKGSPGQQAETLDQVVEILLVRLKPRMERILWHYRIPPQDAEDLVQEILTTLVRRHHTVQNAELWLVSALKYQCLLYWRRRRHRLYRTVDETLLEVLSEPGLPPDERYARKHDLARLLPTIPSRCRKVLKLRYELGMTPKELACELGYRHSSISNIVKRCVAALTARLVAGGYSEARRHG